MDLDTPSDDSVGSLRPLVPRNGDYEWVRLSNDNRSRNERRGTANETTEASDRGWYFYGQQKVLLKSANEAEAGTIVVSPKKTWPDLPQKRRYKCTEIKCSEEGTYMLDVAVKLVEQGCQVAAVSAASAHHVGGGFTSGGRHASEEALCAQSTLYRCLRHAWRQTGVPEGSAYIPEDGAVLSRRVEVFREGTRAGYAPLPKPWELTCVVSVAMPNLNEKVRDAPVRKHSSSKEYRAAIRKLWRATLRAAHTAGASDVVCPDAGCGVYRNDPNVVGAILGEVLCSEYMGHFEKLWLVGDSAFQNAVKAAVDAPQKSEESSIGKLKRRLSRSASCEKERQNTTSPASPKCGLATDTCDSAAHGELKVDTSVPAPSSSKMRLPWTGIRKRPLWKRMCSSSTTASSFHSESESEDTAWRRQPSGETDDCSTATGGTGDVTPLHNTDPDKLSMHRHLDVDAALLKRKLEELCTDACLRNQNLGIVSLGEASTTRPVDSITRENTTFTTASEHTLHANPDAYLEESRICNGREELQPFKILSPLDFQDDMTRDASAPKASVSLRPGRLMLASGTHPGSRGSMSYSEIVELGSQLPDESVESCASALHACAVVNPGVQSSLSIAGTASL